MYVSLFMSFNDVTAASITFLFFVGFESRSIIFIHKRQNMLHVLQSSRQTTTYSHLCFVKEKICDYKRKNV